MTPEEALAELRAVADPSRKPGMARVGIAVDRALGVSVPNVRAIAKRSGTDHRLALGLWRSGVHEARILATLVADPASMTEQQMERWVGQVDSWDLGDAAADLFAATPARNHLIRSWAARDEPFVKRCAFAMIARAAVSDKRAPDTTFLRWRPLVRRASADDRNAVRKGVNWALRQIGKRNAALYSVAIREAETMLDHALRTGSRGGRWIARDVLRELRLEEWRSRYSTTR